MPTASSRLRLRICSHRIATAAAQPSTSDSTFGLPTPKMSGMKPEAIIWNSRGNGPMLCPCSTHMVRPRNTSIPASVTIKLGIFQ